MAQLKGTRIRVSFTNINRTPIPEEYHYEVRNMILKKIQESNQILSQSVHDNWNKFLTFSGFLGKQWETPNGLVFKNIDIILASPDADIISVLKNSFLINHKITLFNSVILVNYVREINFELKSGKNKISYESLGEIVIKKESENGKTLHVTEKDDVKSDLENIIKKQYLAYSGREPVLNIDEVGIIRKKKSIVKNGIVSNSFIALRLKFNLEADEDVHSFILTQGIGHHRKMGFGMVGIRNGEIK